MRKTDISLRLRIIFLFLGSVGILALLSNNHSAFAGDQTLRLESYGATVTTQRSTGVANFVRFPANSPLSVHSRSQAPSDAFLAEYGSVFGIQDPALELQQVDAVEDQHGFTRSSYTQVYKGLSVFGGILHVHSNSAGDITAANGIFVPKIDVDTTASVTSNSAETVAINATLNAHGTIKTNIAGTPLKTKTHLKANHLSVAKSELIIYRTGLVQGIDGENRLAYAIEVTGPNIREFLFIDAQKGTVLDQWAGIHDVLDRRIYETDTSNLVWSEGDPFPGSLTQWQQSEVISAEDTYYLFFNAFGYDSYDNAGITMETVNNSSAVACPNATWNGSTTNYCDGTATDDVVGHEWAHAYTEYTNGLIYAWQPGALNEAYSDIWGETVDILNTYGFTPGDNDDSILRTSCTNSIRWRLGEDATAFGGAIRDMWDPTCEGDPGKVSDTQYECTSFDIGGVHINSGIPNHSYALLVDGGTYNGQTVGAIGMTKAAHIYWRTQATYLTPTSNFAEFASSLQQSCTDLIGINLEGVTTNATPIGLSGEIITAADCTQVNNALLATEMAMEPAQCDFQPLFDPNVPALTCSAGTRSNDHFENFEAGIGGYTVGNIPSNPTTWDARDWTIQGSLPSGRAGQAAFGPDPVVGNCGADLDNGIIYMDSPIITIPAGNIDPYLEFDHWVSMEAGWDGGNLEVSINGGAYTSVPASAFTFNPYNTTLNTANNNPLAGQSAYSGGDEGALSSNWGTSHVDLSAIGANGGKTVQFRWQLGTDGCNGWVGWYVDDITVSSCFAQPALSASKSVNPTGTVLVGDTLEYTINVPNIGGGTANTTITDSFPAGLNNISCNLVTSSFSDTETLLGTVTFGCPSNDVLSGGAGPGQDGRPGAGPACTGTYSGVEGQMSDVDFNGLTWTAIGGSWISDLEAFVDCPAGGMADYTNANWGAGTGNNGNSPYQVGSTPNAGCAGESPTGSWLVNFNDNYGDNFPNGEQTLTTPIVLEVYGYELVETTAPVAVTNGMFNDKQALDGGFDATYVCTGTVSNSLCGSGASVILNNMAVAVSPDAINSPVMSNLVMSTVDIKNSPMCDPLAVDLASNGLDSAEPITTPLAITVFTIFGLILTSVALRRQE